MCVALSLLLQNLPKLQKKLLVVDEKTASASEILSAALKDNGRAKLAGHKTFGKAKVGLLCVVRSMLPLRLRLRSGAVGYHDGFACV